jgi:hypothetical protein
MKDSGGGREADMEETDSYTQTENVNVLRAGVTTRARTR